MAVSLMATARLNAKPYIAGVGKIKAATAGLAAEQINASKKVEAADVSQQSRRKANAAETVRTVRAATREAARVEAEAHSKSIRSLNQGVSAQRYLYGDMARMTARAALGLTALPVAAAAAGIAWERSFADVIRTADPTFADSTNAVNGLRKSLVDMVQTMPTSWGEVTEMATLANQMGIASAETASFTKAAAMFSATSGVSADITATAFGRLRSIVPEVGSDFMGLADSILKVGVNSVATEAEIINIVTQISSIAGAANLSDKEMIGLSGALASVRVPPELSRGVVTRVFGQMSRAVTDGGAKLEGFAKISGMSSEEFAKSWGTKGKSGDALVSFMDGLRKLGPQAEAELRGLGITSVRDVPVMLRLANAADSEGEIGALLKQTIADAENASGETQRQYTIMSDTVGAKLKVVGNNLLAFFDGVGKSALGPLGNILDFIGNGLRDITNGLEDNHKLFGKLSMPFTNAELIGAIASTALLAAGFLAIGSAVLKAREAFAGIQLLGSAFGGGKRGGDPTGVGRIGAQWTAFPNQVRAGITKANAYAATGYAKMRTLGNSGAAANPAMYTTQFAATAEKATARAGTAFSKVGSSIASVGRGIGTAATVAFGPWGLLAGVAIAAIAGWLDSTRAASTDASELAQSIANVGDSASAAAKKMQEVKVGGLFGYESQLFKDGYKDLQQLNAEAAKAREASRVEVTTGNARYAAAANMGKTLGETTRISNEYAESLGIIDKSFGELVNGGNSAQAVGAIRKFAGTAENLYSMVDARGAAKMGIISKDDIVTMESGTKAITGAYKAAFESTGTEVSLENFQKLSRGELPEVQAALYGVAGAAGVTNEELDALAGNEGAYSQMVKDAEAVAQSFINYSEALSNADGGANNMADFTTELKAQMDGQAEWGNNLGKVAKIGGSEAVNAFLGMGAEAAPILKELVDDFEETGGSASGAWKDTLDTIIASTSTAAAQLGPAIAASMESLTKSLGDIDLVHALAAKVTPDEFTTLSRAFEGMGKDAATSLATGIADGSYTVEQALVYATRATRPKIPVETELSQTAFATVKQQLADYAARNNVEIPAGVKLDSNTTVAEFREIMGNPDLFPAIKPEIAPTLTLTEAYSQYDSVRQYMIANGIDIDIAANPALAYLSLDAFTAFANGTVTEAQVNALTTPAEGALYEFVTLADGTVVAVQANIETGEALEGVAVIDVAASEGKTKPVEADTKQAEAAIKQVNDEAKAKQTKPVDVRVDDNGTAAAVQGKINSISGKTVDIVVNETTYSKKISKADGGLVSYYADGGVRENHLAQIAPAGAMRVWAEPETGGEAYIPLAQSKRMRSLAILDNVADRFGYDLQPRNFTKFADGGTYAAQSYDRQVRRATSTSSQAKMNIGEINIGNNQGTDQMRELTRTLNRAARGL